MAISGDEVGLALQSLKDLVVRTPLLEAPLLNRLVEKHLGKKLRVVFKAECLQHTGAFKFRGATNRILKLTPEEKSKGVVAFSSGNFAQALALAAATNNVKCTIVAPHDAPPLKIERTKLYGAHVILSTPKPGENREVAASALANTFAQETGATLLHPFDDFDVMFGQGTLALEAFEQAKAMGIDRLAAMVVPTGGGGMMAGCALAKQYASDNDKQDLNTFSPGTNTRLWTVEPDGYDDHALSFFDENKKRTPLQGTPAKTVCDALQASAPGLLTWQINQNAIHGSVCMPDAAAIEAMKIAFTELKLVLEPSGALGLAALLAGKIHVDEDDIVCIVLCGGNVALHDFVDMCS